MRSDAELKESESYKIRKWINYNLIENRKKWKATKMKLAGLLWLRDRQNTRYVHDGRAKKRKISKSSKKYTIWPNHCLTFQLRKGLCMFLMPMPFLIMCHVTWTNPWEEKNFEMRILNLVSTRVILIVIFFCLCALKKCRKIIRIMSLDWREPNVALIKRVHTSAIVISHNDEKSLKDRSPCLLKRYDEPNLPHLCLFWHQSRASFHRFTVHFKVAGSKGV